jgi:hypothetical protein
MRTKQNTVIWKMSKKSIYNQPKPYPSCSSAWSTWLVHLHLLQGDAGGRGSVLQVEQWEVPLKNACKYYFFHMPLLFCCMILFLTVLWCWMNTFSVMLYLRGHQQFVMRCGFLLVERCMVTCLVFNSDDYYCVICWLFTPYLILFKWYFRIQINHAAFICLQFIGARKWK